MEDRTTAFVGRDKEIVDLLDKLNHDIKSITLLVGESGIGKSRFLDEVYNRLRDEPQNRLFFVGYYDKKRALISESESLIYPFRIVLEDLVKTAKESQQLNERIDNAVARIKRGLIKFVKDQGIKIGVAIIEDLAKKVGLEQTLKIGKEVIEGIGSEKTSLMLAQDYVMDHMDEVRESYLNIFRSIADEFRERSFALIFDQFEYLGKASIDLFLNFTKFIMLEEGFHIIVSFRTGQEYGDISARRLYEETRNKLLVDLEGKELRLEGLSPEDIGKWIKISRGIQLPLVPDLQRIRENSGGLPLLLNGWIKQIQ